MVSTPAKPAPAATEQSPACLRLPEQWPLTDDQFLRLCSLNDGWFFETDPEGRLLIMTGVAPPSGRRGARITAQFVPWSDQFTDGDVFDGTSIFGLPDGSRRMPDMAWVSGERLAQLPSKDPQEVWHLVPDFVLEIVSFTDELEDQQAKMRDVWLANGVRLGWLIDPYGESLYIYRPGTPVEVQDRPSKISDPEVLPHLTVDLTRIWA